MAISSMGLISRKLGEDGNKAVQSYLLDCEVRGLSRRTIKWYKETLMKFLGWMRGEEQIDAPAHISKELVYRFIAYLQGNYRSPYTINGYLRALKGWLRYLVEEEALNQNALDKVKLLRVPQTVFATFKLEQLQTLLKLQNLKTFVGVRNYAMLLVLLDTGIRLSELRAYVFKM